ncbi:acyltransferase [Carboxylicivirga sediminis]|uniref:Acyltransferase n=1 Tax=Carboxylicivirga sediminis TaxID=2006564 RepID=A0A941F903_9BACT|nr:acyltransferase [Carboxylicivirga sediminis]MBR8537803.1 acyltransferase [Carboxylicivirga sediminis]
METTARRYDIDWLRVIAIGLLLIYHAAIVFQPWGVFIGFIQSNDSMDSLWIPMSMLNVWRIPLLFFVSGMGVYFSMRKRSWKQLLTERSWRILLPFIFGMLAIVPLHQFIWQDYYSQAISYMPGRGHLWFLGNIFCYVVLLLPVFYYLLRKPDSLAVRFIRKVMTHPAGALMVALLIMLETILVSPQSYELYAHTWHGFYMGLLAFLFGFLMVWVGQPFWDSILKWRWLYLASAGILFGVRWLVFELQPPLYLFPIETTAWIYTVFAFGYRYLNRPGQVLKYLSKAAYPVYILHMVFLYMGATFVLPMDVPLLIKFLVVTLISLLGSLLVFELFIRRTWLIGVLFGCRRRPVNNYKVPAPCISSEGN